jgi:uncharacterized protein (UPF0303 family)
MRTVEIGEQKSRLSLLAFDARTAWDLGSIIHTIAIEKYPEQSVFISITSVHHDRPMFFACTRDNIKADTFEYLETLRDDVKRWEESNLRRTFGCAPGQESEGGFPITVRGVGGIIAVVVVVGAGWKDYDSMAALNHDIVVEGLERVLKQQ